LIGDCSEERLGIAFLEFGQHEQCGKVGAALRSLSLASTSSAAKSGRRSKRFLGAICPAMMAFVAPVSFA
jgi:hypothetical protein